MFPFRARPQRARAGARAAVMIARAALVSAVVAGAASCAPGGSARRAAAPADTAAVRALLGTQVEAWNRGDLEGFLAGYRRSDSLTFYSGGTASRGWQAAHDRYHRRYVEGDAEMGRLAFDLHALEPLDAEHVLVKGAWALELPTGSPHGLFTLVVRRLPAGWRIVHDHSSVAAE